MPLVVEWCTATSGRESCIPLFLAHEKGFKLVISQPTFCRGFVAQVFVCFRVALTLIIR
jgi:hypothetical protein